MDELTLTIVLGFTSLLASAMFFWVAVHAREIPGVRLWGAGCLAIGLELFIAIPGLIPVWQLASLFANGVFSLGQVFMLAGTLRFCGRPPRRDVLVLLAASGLVLTITFTFIIADGRWRIGSLAFLQAAIKTWMAIVLWQYGRIATRWALRTASLAMALEAAACLAQVGSIAMNAYPLSFSSPETPLMNAIVWGTTLVSTLVGSWILFLLVALRLAERDALTGLLNRRGLWLRLHGMTHARSGSGSLAIMILDIDHFKAINDSHGHDVGDKVLATMGAVLGKLDADLLACRWGGEEFCLAISGAKPEALTALADGIRRDFQTATGALPELATGRTVSVGIAINSSPFERPIDVTFKAADAELYRAKQLGRDRVALAAV